VVFVAALLAMDLFMLCMSLAQVWSKPFVNDWLSFYTGGTLARTGNWADLYDTSAQTLVQQRLLGAGFEAPLGYLLPAFVAFGLAPLTNLSFALSYTIWMLANVSILSGLVVLSWRWLHAVPRDVRAVFLASAITLPGMQVLTHGQFDLLVLAGMAGCYALLRDGRPTLAGAVLALALCKPHLVLAVVALLLVTRQWRAIGAFAVTGGALMLAPALAAGPGVVTDQLQLLVSFNSGPTNELVLPLLTMINVRAMVVSLTGSSNIWLWLPLMLATSAAAFAAALRVWTVRPALHAQSWALAFVLPLIYSPHVHIQSLILFAAAAGLYLIDSQASSRPIAEIKYPMGGLLVIAVLWNLSIEGGLSFLALIVLAGYAFFSLRWPDQLAGDAALRQPALAAAA
jgi:hypothetical protein